MAKKKSMYEVGDIVETQTINGLVKGVVEKKLYAELNPPVWIYTIKGKLADGAPYMANSVREEDIISIKNQTNMSIKDKKGAYEFKNSNLRFHGMKMDINGNPCFVLSTPNQRAFSVQQPYSITIHWSTKNGNSKESGVEIVEKNTKGNPFKSEEEFESYVLDLAKGRKHVKVYNSNFACGKSNLVSLELPKEIEYKGKKVKITADGIRTFIVGNERFGYGEGRINYLGDPTNGLENAEKEAVEEIKRMIDYAFEKKDLLKSVIEKAKKNKKCYAICHTTMSEKRRDIESKYDVVKEWTILNEKDPYHAITEYKNTKPERKVVFYPDYIVDKNGKLIDDRSDYKKERFENYLNFSILDDIFSGGILMF